MEVLTAPVLYTTTLRVKIIHAAPEYINRPEQVRYMLVQYEMLSRALVAYQHGSMLDSSTLPYRVSPVKGHEVQDSPSVCSTDVSRFTP